MKFKKINKGMALITLLILCVLMAMFTTALISISSTHLQLIGDVEQQMRAYKAAQAMAEYALNRLNSDPAWGIWDPNTGPNPGDNVEVNLDGSTGTIKFSGSNYLSYNNLKNTNKVNRATIGDSSLNTGTIPAYTAEIICKGEARNSIKYIKVIYVRNDVYPYNINENGKIQFDAGRMTVTGFEDDSPGQLHSNWQTDPNATGDYSINTAHGVVDAKSGLATSVGDSKIDVPYANAVSIQKNLGPYGKEDFENINPGKIIDNRNKSTCVDIGPGTVQPGPLYYIPSDKPTMFTVLNAGLGTINSETYAASLGLPVNMDEAKEQTPGTDDWIETTGWSPVYQNITFTDVAGSTTNDNWNKVGFNTVTGTKFTAGVSWSLTGKHKVKKTEPDPEDPNKTIEVEVIEETSASGSNILTDLSGGTGGVPNVYSLPKNSWGPNRPGGEVGENVESNYGMIKTDFASNNMEKFMPEGEIKEYGMTLKITEENDVKKFTFTLDKDLYIGNSSGTLKPKADDYKKTIDDNNKITDGSPDNVFRFKRPDYRIIEPIAKKTNQITSVVIAIDLNSHTIYSDSHLLMGAQIITKPGQTGTMVTRGKMAYLLGANSSNLISIAGDDIYLQSSGDTPDYKMNGLTYSSDDIRIEQLKSGGSLSGGGGDNAERKLPLNRDIMCPDGTNLKFTESGGGEEYVSVMKKTISSPSGSADYYVIKAGVKFNLGGTDFTVEKPLAMKTTDPFTITPADAVSPTLDDDKLNAISGKMANIFSGPMGIDNLILSGPLVGMNCNTTSDDDNQNNSLNVTGLTGTGNVTFKYKQDVLGKLCDLRGNDFHVRITGWYDLN